jgi:hypothetical protein
VPVVCCVVTVSQTPMIEFAAHLADLFAILANEFHSNVWGKPCQPFMVFTGSSDNMHRERCGRARKASKYCGVSAILVQIQLRKVRDITRKAQVWACVECATLRHPVRKQKEPAARNQRMFLIIQSPSEESRTNSPRYTSDKERQIPAGVLSK